MYKIGIIGSRDVICGFAAVGIDIFPVEDEIGAKSALSRLAAEDYGIIYITEDYAKKIQNDIAQYSSSLTPAVIPLPAGSGDSGFGTGKVRSMVERAVGSDILFGNN
ncbi:MAG: V-type ATP synthase subunit F [Clostridiales bacterium]|nr:V-type ATP synthase subunit F [Clostridiales bacterium]